MAGTVALLGADWAPWLAAAWRSKHTLEPELRTAALLRTGTALLAAEPQEASLATPAEVEAGLPAAVEQLRERLPPGLGAWHEQACRVAKNDVDRAARVLRGLRAFRSAQRWPLPLTAADVGPQCLRSGMHELLPADREGRPVLLYRAARLDTRAHSIEDYQRLGCYLMEVATRDPGVQHRGVTLLLDLAGADLGLAAAFRVTDVTRGVHMWKDAFPAKLKRLLVVNAGGSVRAFSRVALRLLRPKMQARLLFLGPEELQEELGAASLPPDLGGSLDPGWWGRWCDEQEEREERERDLLPQEIDEELRPEELRWV